jgi:hypothetical protein
MIAHFLFDLRQDESIHDSDLPSASRNASEADFATKISQNETMTYTDRSDKRSHFQMIHHQRGIIKN